MIKTALLADYPETIPTLAKWFRVQWSEYYAEHTLTEIAQDFHSEANRNGLPVRLVAFSNGELAGTITLRERALQDLSEFQPGLGGLFIVEQHRGQGIGTELVKSGMKVAQQQGYKRIYTATVMAKGILEHLGWKRILSVSHGDEQLLIYSCEL